MDKQEFLARLETELRGLPQDDAAERLAFYGEMIDDRVEDGLTEAEAVAGLGPVEAVAAQIVAETPLPRLVRERMRPGRRLRAWEIVLLALGSPVWFPLLIAAAAVLLSVYLVIWSVILSLWAAEVSLIAGALGGAAAGFLVLCRGDAAQGLLGIAAGLVLAGLSVFLFFGCRAASRGALVLTQRIALGVKSLFLRKESVQ